MRCSDDPHWSFSSRSNRLAKKLQARDNLIVTKRSRRAGPAAVASSNSSDPGDLEMVVAQKGIASWSPTRTPAQPSCESFTVRRCREFRDADDLITLLVFELSDSSRLSLIRNCRDHDGSGHLADVGMPAIRMLHVPMEFIQIAARRRMKHPLVPHCPGNHSVVPRRLLQPVPVLRRQEGYGPAAAEAARDASSANPHRCSSGQIPLTTFPDTSVSR